MRPIPALLFAAALAAAPASAVAGPSTPTQTVEHVEWSTSKGRLGVMVMSLTPELRKHFGAADDRGVLVAHVEPGTPAAKAGIAVGDVIVEVRGRAVDDATDVLSALADVGKGQQAKLTVVRDGKSRSLDATLNDDASASSWTTPFDDPWFREWMKPIEPKPSDSTSASNWIRKLRELFDAKKDTQNQRS